MFGDPTEKTHTTSSAERLDTNVACGAKKNPCLRGNGSGVIWSAPVTGIFVFDFRIFFDRKKGPDVFFFVQLYTPENYHLEPKNHPNWKGKSSEPNLHFWGSMLTFQDVKRNRDGILFKSVGVENEESSLENIFTKTIYPGASLNLGSQWEHIYHYLTQEPQNINLTDKIVIHDILRSKSSHW